MRTLFFAILCGLLLTGATPARAQGAPPPAPAPDQAAPVAAAGPLADDTASLFSPRWNMFQLSGRLSSVEGDPARWQRYEDLRDGVLFATGRLLRETPEWSAALTADNLGWRDQRYSGSFERIGRFSVTGLW